MLVVREIVNSFVCSYKHLSHNDHKWILYKTEYRTENITLLLYKVSVNYGARTTTRRLWVNYRWKVNEARFKVWILEKNFLHNDQKKKILKVQNSYLKEWVKKTNYGLSCRQYSSTYKNDVERKKSLFLINFCRGWKLQRRRWWRPQYFQVNGGCVCVEILSSIHSRFIVEKASSRKLKKLLI